MRTLLCLSVLVALTSCNTAVGPLRPFVGHRAIKRLTNSDGSIKDSVGRMSGEPHFASIGPCLFVFDPSIEPDNRFSFTTSARYGDHTGPVKTWTIIPDTMITSGSSVPRLLWPTKGLAPMDFARAAVIHDWLFEARHRWSLAATVKDPVIMAKYAYAGDPVGQALGNHEATEAAPALTVDEAADIMGEVMIHEMHYYSNGLAAVRSAAGRTPTQARGLKELEDGFALGSTKRSTLGFYDWAIRSSVAKDYWKPKDKKASEGTSITMIEALQGDQPGDPNTDILVQARDSKAITSALYNKLIAMVNDDRRRVAAAKAAIAARDTPQAKVKAQNQAIAKVQQRDQPAKAAAISAIRAGDSQIDIISTAAISRVAATAAAARYLGSLPHFIGEVRQGKKLPSLTEVRYYHFPDDKARAEEIVAALKSKGIPARASFVIDSGGLPNAFQIAVASDKLAQFAP